MTETCDTSVLVPALLSWHPAHRECRRAVSSVESVGGHVLLETLSVLTRLPAPHRVGVAQAGAAIDALPWATVVLPADQHADLIRTLAAHGVGGGAVYDALVGATAHHHGLTLVTRDRRARRTYDEVGATYTVL